MTRRRLVEESVASSDTSRMQLDLTRACRWAANRTWSRAGAIAAVIAVGAPRAVLVLSTRVALLIAGSLTISVAVAIMLWSGFGPGPLDVFIVGLSESTGLPLTFAVWSAFGLLLALAMLLGRRPGVGTILTPIVVGPTVQFLLASLSHVDAPGSIVGRAAVHLVAIGMAGFGAGALIVSGLGAGTGELLATAAADRTGRPERCLRLGFELGWLLVGVMLGGPIGAGTVLVALLIGPAVVVGHRVMSTVVVGSHQQLRVMAATSSEGRRRELASVT